MGMEGKAAGVAAPVAQADSTGRRGVFRYAGSATVQSASVPTAFKSNYVTHLSVGVDTQIAYGSGSAGPALVYNATSSFGTNSNFSGRTCLNGVPFDCIVPEDVTWISWISSGSTGFVEFTMSERLGGLKF